MRAPPSASGAAGVFGLCLARSALSGFGTHDESWFLQVLDRVTRGEVLYRDVFFGSTPLSVQVLGPIVRRTGSEVLVLRAAAAAMTAATALLACDAAKRAGAWTRDPEASALLGLAVAVYGSPAEPNSPYSLLATVSQMACLRAALGRGEVRDAAVAGAAAGACLATKPNVGLATLGAASLSLGLWRSDRRRHALAASGALAAVVAASLGPVFARRAGPRFLEYAFTNKRRYLRLGGLSYRDGLHPLYRRGEWPVRQRYAATKFVLAPAAALALAAGGLARPRRALLVLGIFGLASTSAAYPRPDEPHVTWTLPPLLVALAAALAGLPTTTVTRRAGRSLAWVWLGLGVAGSLDKPFAAWRSGRARITHLSHFRGVLEDRGRLDDFAGKAQALRRVAERSPGATFLLAPDAGHLYLLAGLRNPTPYDFPYATALGRTGEDDIAAAIRRGEITAVLIDPVDPRLASWNLIEAARAALPLVDTVGGEIHAVLGAPAARPLARSHNYRVPETPSASVVIPTFAAADYLEVTLASVMPQAAELGAEVIVVSDGPDDPTARVNERQGARLVTLPEQRGLNAARNAGLEAARAELIVFIDQDIDAPPGWLAALLAGARRYPEDEVFGGPIRARLEHGPRGCGREPPPITTLDAGPEDREVSLVWGANMAIRRSAFERLGRFDEVLHGRGNEEDWEFRYTSAGGRIRYLAEAGLDHRRAAPDARLRVLARHAYGQGREARRHDVRAGKTRPVPTELRILAGCAWHTVRRRCAYGIVMGARTAGSLREAWSRPGRG